MSSQLPGGPHVGGNVNGPVVGGSGNQVGPTYVAGPGGIAGEHVQVTVLANGFPLPQATASNVRPSWINSKAAAWLSLFVGLASLTVGAVPLLSTPSDPHASPVVVVGERPAWFIGAILGLFLAYLLWRVQRHLRHGFAVVLPGLRPRLSNSQGKYFALTVKLQCPQCGKQRFMKLKSRLRIEDGQLRSEVGFVCRKPSHFLAVDPDTLALP